MKLSLLRTVSPLALPTMLLAVAASGLFVQNAGGQAVGSQESGSGQTEDLHGLKVKQINPPASPSPFPLDVSTGRVQMLEFRSPEQMTAADRDLAEASQGEIARRAEFHGLHIGPQGMNDGWGYEQAVCPVFPDHLVLEYSRNDGAGDVTLFSVAIPRGDGHVRVIPVQRRSYSLFTPVASNALTLTDFNHIVLEEHHGITPDWLTLGLCYSALAGGHVRAGLRPRDAADEHYPLVISATLRVSRKPGAEVDFVDTTPHTEGMEWALMFAQDGRLLKVRHTPARKLTEKATKRNVEDVRGVPTKESVIEIPKQ